MDIYNLYHGNGIQKFEIIRMHEIATSFVPHDSQRRQEGSADVVKDKTPISTRDPDHPFMESLSKRTVPDAEPVDRSQINIIRTIFLVTMLMQRISKKRKTHYLLLKVLKPDG